MTYSNECIQRASFNGVCLCVCVSVCVCVCVCVWLLGVERIRGHWQAASPAGICWTSRGS